jgi:hypothetical protein
MGSHNAQELGLNGNLIVERSDPSYWPQADRDVVLTLDDILIEGREDRRLRPGRPGESRWGLAEDGGEP